MKLYQYFSRPSFQPDTKPPAQDKPPDDEKRRKVAEEKAAAIDKIEWCSSMISRYADLQEQIEQELAENSKLSRTKQIQLQKQSLSIEEKIRKFTEQRNKAYYIATS